jgi:hypothetical protein
VAKVEDHAALPARLVDRLRVANGLNLFDSGAQTIASVIHDRPHGSSYVAGSHYDQPTAMETAG